MVHISEPWDMVEKFKNHLNENGYVRYVVYDPDENYFANPNAPTSVNVASVIAGQEKYLMVDESLVDEAEALGLVERENALNYDEFAIFNEYRDDVNTIILASF